MLVLGVTPFHQNIDVRKMSDNNLIKTHANGKKRTAIQKGECFVCDLDQKKENIV